MRKLFIIALAVISITATAFCAKVDFKAKIFEFTKTYFSHATVSNISPDGKEFKARLTDNTSLRFDHKVRWEEIDCENSMIYTSVPTQLVPEQISSFVKQNHPHRNIVKIKKEKKNWEIELDNELEIEFDKKFNVVEMDH